MKNGVCPKCGSENVRTNVETPQRNRMGGRAVTISGGVISSGWFVDEYVCANCGYMESYVSDPERLKAIEDKWPRVSDLKRKNNET